MILLSHIGAWGLMGVCLSAVIVAMIKNSRAMGLVFVFSILACAWASDSGYVGDVASMFIVGLIAVPVFIFAIDYKDYYHSKVKGYLKRAFKKKNQPVRYPE